jgi:hypothetical protein
MHACSNLVIQANMKIGWCIVCIKTLGMKKVYAIWNFCEDKESSLSHFKGNNGEWWAGGGACLWHSQQLINFTQDR